jgi:predicted O-linked N-acetylglucosamine transferase (SPINDLY family)
MKSKLLKTIQQNQEKRKNAKGKLLPTSQSTVDPKNQTITGPPASSTKQIPVNDVVGDAVRILEEEGIQEVFVYFEKLANAQERIAVAMPLRLTTLAGVVQQKNPKAALQLAQRALSLNDQNMAACLLIGSIQDRLGDRDASAESMRRVVRSPLSRPDQVVRAANLLVRFGEQQEALESSKAAYDKLGRPIQLASTLMYIAKITADWKLVEDLKVQLIKAYAKGQWAEIAESPRTHLLWCGDEATNIKVLKYWSERSIRLPNEVSSPTLEPLDGRRIRVGYLSSDFRDHPTSRLINGLFRHHDRSKFELFMYCSSWDDNSDMRKEIESQFEHRYSVSQLSDEAAAQLIKAHRIDVLVELNGPTRAHRMGILAHRPAPVQIDYLGWPGSVGGRVVDYIVGDEYTVPSDVEALYPEKVIKLSKTYQINDFASRTLPQKPTRKSVGLPDGDHLILGMFNAINKVDSVVWNAWMRIMQAVPNSLLWLLDPGPVARNFIAEATKNQGIDVKRIVIAPRMKQDEHLARMQCCDLMLDPWPYGGHTSTSDALFAKVPVIALQGTNFCSRVSGGLLRAAGMGIMVQPDVESYVNKAIELLRNPRMLKHVKQYLSEKVPSSNLFDAKGKTEQLEAMTISLISKIIKNSEQVKQNIFSEQTNECLALDLSISTLNQHSAEIIISKQHSNNQLKIAIITPYYKESDDLLRRCIESVAFQNYPCDHFLISDGHPKEWIDSEKVRHIKLGISHSDYGNTPRGIGAQLAVSEEYDAIAFLDADNWFDINHIEECLNSVVDKYNNWLDCDYVIAQRRFRREDLSILNINDEPNHIDTNCYLFLPGSFFLLPTWNMIPKVLSSVGDRVFQKLIFDYNLTYVKNKLITVNYLDLWASHYKILGEKIPINAKENVSSKKSIEKFMMIDKKRRILLERNFRKNFVDFK